MLNQLYTNSEKSYLYIYLLKTKNRGVLREYIKSRKGISDIKKNPSFI